MLNFTKMNGAGNDFVMVDNRDGSLALDKDTIARLCDRHRGIGADGLLAVEPAQNGADFRMRYYNADGGEAEMCGNGARCFARFASKLAGKTEAVSFETIAGVITAKAAQPGAIGSPLSAGGGFTRTGIGTIVDMDSLEVEVDVGEAFIGRVQPQMPVEATLNAYPDWKIPAEVIAVIPTADRGKATVKVRIALKQKDPRIVPEMGVNVSFLETTKPQTAQRQPQGVRVPAAAIVDREGAEVAFVLGDDGERVEQRTLKTGMALGNDRLVRSGLGAGDTVVLDPPAELKDGAKVKVAQEDAE